MKNELDIDDIELLIAQARRYRSNETGRLIACNFRTAVSFLLARGDRILHALLMSPTGASTRR